MGEMSVMGKEGDTKVIWDPDNEDEVATAERSYNDLIKKGFKAFSVKARGQKGEQMDEWYPDEGKIIMVPRMAGG